MEYPRKPYGKQPIDQDLIDIYFGIDAFKHLWVGPHIPPDKDPKGTKTAELRRAFRYHNLLREVIDNWRDGLIAKPFAISVRSNGNRLDDTDAQSEKALKLLNLWIAKVNEQAIASDPSASDFNQCDPWSEFVTALGVLGCANLRLWQHNDELCLHVPQRGAVGVDYDDNTFIEKITYRTGKVSEVHRLNERGQMEVSTEVGEGESEDGTIAVDTEGRWFIQVMHGESLLTESAISKQAALCHDLTMLMRNQEHAGFKRRTLLNAELPPEDEDYEVGPGIDEYLPGIATQGIDGTVTYSTPTVHESQPFPVDNFEKSTSIWTTLIYREFRQGHLAADAASKLSGESRIQMRASMLVYLERWARRIEAAFSNVLTLVLHLNGNKSLDVVVDLNLSTGVMSSEERKELIAEYQAGLLSRKSAIALLGSVSDPDAEIEALEEELRSQSAAPVVEPGIVEPEPPPEDNS